MGRVSQRLPNFFRRMAQLSDKNERPIVFAFSYLRPAGGTRRVLLVIDHLALLVFLVLRRIHPTGRDGILSIYVRGSEPIVPNLHFTGASAACAHLRLVLIFVGAEIVRVQVTFAGISRVDQNRQNRLARHPPQKWFRFQSVETTLCVHRGPTKPASRSARTVL